METLIAAETKGRRIILDLKDRRFPMKKDTPMDRLDPARTALVVVHMVKGVAGEVDLTKSRLKRLQSFPLGSCI